MSKKFYFLFLWVYVQFSKHNATFLRVREQNFPGKQDKKYFFSLGQEKSVCTFWWLILISIYPIYNDDEISQLEVYLIVDTGKKKI